MEKTLHHHNVRMQPGDDSYIAVRVTLCVSAIQQSPACQRMRYTVDVNHLYDGALASRVQVGARALLRHLEPPVADSGGRLQQHEHLRRDAPPRDGAAGGLKLFTEDVLWVKKIRVVRHAHGRGAGL